MATSEVIYLGDLRTECTHLKSGNKMITDAPVDNNGKGEAFSPTDTVSTALASCMLTIMGIKAAELNLEFEGAKALVTKHMSANPRKISKIEVEIEVYGISDTKNQKILERVAKTCPVALSLHPDIEQVVSFHFQ